MSNTNKNLKAQLEQEYERASHVQPKSAKDAKHPHIAEANAHREAAEHASRLHEERTGKPLVFDSSHGVIGEKQRNTNSRAHVSENEPRQHEVRTTASKKEIGPHGENL
ncbi:hypothetical protein BKA69DRAFT_1036678 [Paraphysoderma sedebokerense]|nr:hypothetical protein BKA69DRAFT_1036678 [Paraphysoderma sedebokerense]